jgi:viroplasmin and RNaseH domain-containing protein
MIDAKIDPSLAEVRQWKDKVQADLAHLDSKSEIEETHRRAQNFMRKHGLKLKVEKESRETVMS